MPKTSVERSSGITEICLVRYTWLARWVPTVRECWPTATLLRKSQNCCTHDIFWIQEEGEELRELVRWECGEGEAELCAVGPPVTSQIVLKSLQPWTASCYFFFFGCIGSEFLIWECWCGMNRESTCRSGIKDPHDKACPWGFGEKLWSPTGSR